MAGRRREQGRCCKQDRTTRLDEHCFVWYRWLEDRPTFQAQLFPVCNLFLPYPAIHTIPSMHLVTSSLFLPSWTAYLTPRSISRLLRTYFAVCLAWWISRGRPPLDTRSFFASSTVHPTAPGPHPTPSETTFPKPTHPDALTPNPWLPIIQTALVHENEHLCKLQRSLAHYAALYGTRTAGGTDFANTELEGAELLDGTLFIRIAGLTADKMGWVREGEEVRNWDRIVYFNE